MAMRFSGGTLGSGDGFVFGDAGEPSGVLIGVGGGQGPAGPVGAAGPAGPKGDPGPVGSGVDVTKLPHVSVLADADSVLAGSVGGVSQKITVAELRLQLDSVRVAPVVSSVVDADGFAIADSADSFKVKRFSWLSLKAHILAWFGPVTATLSNKTLTAPKVTGTTAAAGTVTVSSADPNVSLNLVSKGTGKVLVNGVEAVDTTSAQSLSKKTLVSPTITGPTISPVTAGPNALALTVGSAQVRANGTNVAFGSAAQNALTTGGNNIALGTGAQQEPLGSVTGSVVDFPTTTAKNQTSVGAQSGQNTATQIDGITTIGYRATAGAVNGTSLGISSRADHTDSVALGSKTVTTAANQVAVGPRDIEIGDATKGLVLKSPDGKRWRVTVDNAGALSAAAV